MPAGDHLGALLGGQREVVVVSRRYAPRRGGARSRAHVAEAVGLLGGRVALLAVGPVASDHLDRPRGLPADQHVAVVYLEALGQPAGDVDQRALGGVRTGAATREAAAVGARRTRGRQVLGEGLRVGHGPGRDGAHALGQHELGGRVAPLPVSGEQLDHADAVAAQHERQRKPAAFERRGGTRRAREVGVGRDEQRLAVADHAGRDGVDRQGPRAAYGGAHPAHVVADHRLERVAPEVDQRKHRGRAVHRPQQAGADQGQPPVGAKLVDRPRGGVDQRQERLGAQLLFADIDEEPLSGALVARSTSHPASSAVSHAGGREAAAAPAAPSSPHVSRALSQVLVDRRAAKHDKRTPGRRPAGPEP